jgi:hypothetical protein
MVRSYGIGTLIVALAATGLAWGQPAAAPTLPKDSTGRIIEVAENGGPKQKCKILKEWVEPDGAKAYQVEALDTGEILTMVTSGPVTTEIGAGNHVKTVTTRIFHWGRSKTPPPNAPVPPAAAIVRDVPKDIAPAVVRDLPKPAGADHAPPIIQTQATTVTTPSPATGSRVWPPAFGDNTATPTSAATPQNSGAMIPGATIIQSGAAAKSPVATVNATPAPVWSSPSIKQPVSSTSLKQPVCSSPYQVSGCASDQCATVSGPSAGVHELPVAANSSPYQQCGWVSGNGPSQPCAAEGSRSGSCQPCVVECPQNVPVCSSPYQSCECPCECGNAKPPRRTLLSRLRGDPKPSCDGSTPCQPCTTQIVQADGGVIAPGALPECVPSKPETKNAVSTTTAPQPNDWRQSWRIFRRNNTNDKADMAKTDATKKAELPQADAKRADPLTSPEAYTSKLPADLDSKPKSLPAEVETPVKTLSALPPSKEAGSAVLPAYTRTDPPAATAPPASAPSGSGVPLGAESVAQAGNPPCLPVSVVTLPPVQRMPAPPAPRVPQAPQPNQALLANAFSAPMSSGPPPTSSDLSGNAFSPPAAPASQTGAGAFAEGNANVAAHAGQGVFGPGYVRMAFGTYPPGYGPMGQQVYMPGYGPGGYPPVPFGGMAQPNQYAQMPPNGYGQTPPAGYYGPMNQAAMTASYRPPAPKYLQPGMASVAAASAPAPQGPSGEMDATRLLGMLRESLYPSEREWAADKLAVVDWRINGQVVQALILGAKEDPAATVRAGCVRSLARMNVNTVPVVAAVNSLKTDTDPRVQREVEHALARLAPSQRSTADQAVQPASAVVPAKSN